MRKALHIFVAGVVIQAYSQPVVLLDPGAGKTGDIESVHSCDGTEMAQRFHSWMKLQDEKGVSAEPATSSQIQGGIGKNVVYANSAQSGVYYNTGIKCSELKDKYLELALNVAWRNAGWIGDASVLYQVGFMNAGGVFTPLASCRFSPPEKNDTMTESPALFSSMKVDEQSDGFLAVNIRSGSPVKSRSFFDGVRLRVLDQLPGSANDSNPFLKPVPRPDMVWGNRNGLGWMERHNNIVQQASTGDAELIFIGDSITHWWEGRGDELWEKYYQPFNAINMGFGGDRIEHVLWRLKNGEIDGISPKVAVLMIGTNNARDNHPDYTAQGIRAICSLLRKKLPDTKILLLGIFPRNTPDDSKHLHNMAVNAMIAKLADDPSIEYLDIGHVFMNEEGLVNMKVMADPVHPGPEGYRLWADAMNPKLFQLMQ